MFVYHRCISTVSNLIIYKINPEITMYVFFKMCLWCWYLHTWQNQCHLFIYFLFQSTTIQWRPHSSISEYRLVVMSPLLKYRFKSWRCTAELHDRCGLPGMSLINALSPNTNISFPLIPWLYSNLPLNPNHVVGWEIMNGEKKKTLLLSFMVMIMECG